jgi:hypothetical protein
MGTKQTTKRGTDRTRSKQRLKALARRYAQVLRGINTQEAARRKLSKELYELALDSEDAELALHEHTFGPRKTKPVVKHVPLASPEAALWLMCCNIWVPLPIIVCILAGCPPVLLPPGRVCFLINCQMKVRSRIAGPCPRTTAKRVRLRFLLTWTDT